MKYKGFTAFECMTVEKYNVEHHVTQVIDQAFNQGVRQVVELVRQESLTADNPSVLYTNIQKSISQNSRKRESSLESSPAKFMLDACNIAAVRENQISDYFAVYIQKTFPQFAVTREKCHQRVQFTPFYKSKIDLSISLRSACCNLHVS